MVSSPPSIFRKSLGLGKFHFENGNTQRLHRNISSFGGFYRELTDLRYSFQSLSEYLLTEHVCYAKASNHEIVFEELRHIEKKVNLFSSKLIEEPLQEEKFESLGSFPFRENDPTKAISVTYWEARLPTMYLRSSEFLREFTSRVPDWNSNCWTPSFIPRPIWVSLVEGQSVRLS